MKSLILPILGVAAFIILVGLFTKNYGNFPSGQNASSSPVQTATKEAVVGSTKINIEIANSEEERRKGLSGRDALGTNSGMLFVFPQKQVIPSFWMKDMKFPLDLIWINDGKIAKIDKYVPAPSSNTNDSQLPLYRPDKPVDYVVEVNSGFADRNNLSIGDSVSLPLQ